MPEANAPQAIVKHVRQGGTRHASGLSRQLKYLSREGELNVERSQRYAGGALNPAEFEQFANSWALETGIFDGRNGTRNSLSTHLVVSFPPGTNPDNARESARDWAWRMFGGAEGQPAYDYYTVSHRDREHPHTHIVVNRRGIDGRDWLKIANRHPTLNYPNMRKVMVEIASQYNIDLEASTRGERGVDGRNQNDGQYRRARRGTAEPPQIRIPFFDPTEEPHEIGDGSTPRALTSAGRRRNPFADARPGGGNDGGGNGGAGPSNKRGDDGAGPSNRQRADGAGPSNRQRVDNAAQVQAGEQAAGPSRKRDRNNEPDGGRNHAMTLRRQGPAQPGLSDANEGRASKRQRGNDHTPDETPMEIDQPSRKRDRGGNEKTMELRSEKAKRARIEADRSEAAQQDPMRLRSGNALGDGGPKGPQDQNRDPENQGSRHR